MVDLNRTIEAVWRMESASVIARLTRMVRDLGLAEDLAQDALVAAFETWPRTGVPERPGAWLMTTARNRALDRLRRDKRLTRKLEEYGRTRGFGPSWPEFDPEEVEDDVLRLVFLSCHPVLSPEAQSALTLKVLGGLSTVEIARAYLVSAPTIAQRIVRAKRILAEARVPFEVPGAEDRRARLSSVLEVLYLMFNEGYAATSGEHWMRPVLCDEALRLGRIVAELMPDEPEVHGLVALMEIQASRTPARVNAAGEPILLLDQDRSRWDPLLIRRGLTALDRAGALGRGLGPYGLQAAIAACHARARTPEQTDWKAISALYDALARLQPSPVVELNRAVAVSRAQGAAAGLDLVEALKDDPVLRGYHLLPAVRGDLLSQLQRHEEAASEFERAAGLTQNLREQTQLLARTEAARALQS